MTSSRTAGGSAMSFSASVLGQEGACAGGTIGRQRRDRGDDRAGPHRNPEKRCLVANTTRPRLAAGARRSRSAAAGDHELGDECRRSNESGMDQGARELQIATDQDREDRVSLTVRDSGPVLKPEALERFFEAFYSTKPTGMGIGLSICRSIIEAHEGRILAIANVSRGATVHITLPASRTNAPR